MLIIYGCWVVIGERREIIWTFLECVLLLFLKEIPPDLVCDINQDCATIVFKFLLEKQKWPEVLLLLTRKVSGEPPLGDCLIKDCNFSDLDICTIIPHLSTWDQRKKQLLGRLIDSGGESDWMLNVGDLSTFSTWWSPGHCLPFPWFWRHHEVHPYCLPCIFLFWNSDEGYCPVSELPLRNSAFFVNSSYYLSLLYGKHQVCEGSLALV